MSLINTWKSNLHTDLIVLKYANVAFSRTPNERDLASQGLTQLGRT